MVSVIRNKKGEILLCKMPENRGVYPGQWALPGGGIEEGEKMEEALHREIWEEVGLKLKDVRAIYFQDEYKIKIHGDGRREKLYMIYLIFESRALEGKVKLNPEFDEYAWVKETRLNDYDLNRASIKTFTKMGYL